MIAAVSVVIPVCNGELHVAQCLRSVLESSLPPAEVWVVDDGSEDGTVALVQQFPQVKLARQARAGASAARNHGLSLARSELVAFQDADDLMTPNRLRVQANFLTRRAEVDAVFGEVEQFSDPPGAYACDSRPQPARLAGTMLARRSLFEKVGLFDPGYQAAEFIDWFLRAQEAGAHFQDLPELVLRRRLHAANGGRIRPQARQDYARVVAAALRRRRGL